MFEYAALVDAPVQRFTGIVTGSDPDEDAVVVPMLETPSALVAGERSDALAPDLGDAVVAAPVDAAPVVAAPVAPVPAIVERSAPVAARRIGARATPSKPTILPTLIGVAAAVVTAMWWLRRESQHR